MAGPKMPVERRENPRYQVADGAFVLLGAHSKTLAQIVEVSLGGLSFIHVSGEVLLNGTSEATIILEDHSFYFDKIPCAIISHSSIPTELSLGSRTVRRGSIAFGELSPDQKSQLEYFIRNHTTGQLKA